MASIWQEFVDTVDGWISVDDGHFYSDLRFLPWIPAIPFFVIFNFLPSHSLLSYVVGGLVLFVPIPWTIFLFKRRAIKKQSWVEPTRFSDLNGGY